MKFQGHLTLSHQGKPPCHPLGRSTPRDPETTLNQHSAPGGIILLSVSFQVHSVMSMLFYTLITALLIGIQAAPHTESNVPAGHAIPQAHWIKLQHSLDTVLRRAHSAPAGPIAARVAGQTHNITVDPKLFKKRRLRSPRVLFSTQPPPVAADTQDLDFEAGGASSFNRTHRSKRSSSHPVFHRGEFSVCDSISVWVGDKTTATDIKGTTQNM